MVNSAAVTVTEDKVWHALGGVMDPEIPFSVVDLGLVYGVAVDDGTRVRVQMTLTTKGCPLVRHISADAEAAIKRETGATEVVVEIVWDPVWNHAMAAENVRAHFGWH
ncbi:MAG: metal-sulfur cluster assembly factor [Acidobacteria bacterium]|nr:metal-sulfur cluster assembly factor [Acidobacteriota bacterium]